LIESYLTNRYQRVQLDSPLLSLNAVSNWCKVKYGVPHLSVLGPLFFLVYVNVLPNTLTHYALPILFADDTSILITSHNVHKFQNKHNSAFGQITNWFLGNLLFLTLEELILRNNVVRV
jgi:hypothetical protein